MAGFADSLALSAAAPNTWTGESDGLYSHQAGQFGGWTAAVLLRAAMLEPGDRGEPLSLTVLFTDAVVEGQLRVSTRLLRSGSRLQFWRAELSQAEKLRAHAQVTFGVRRETTRFTDAAMPDVPGPDDDSLTDSRPPATFGKQFSMRWVTQSPLQGPTAGPARSVFWTRDVHSRPMDHCLLAMLADLAPPRVLYRRNSFSPSSTVSMTVHFHATPQELAEVGSDHVLSEIDCRRCEGGYFDHQLKIWSRSGALLATSEQVAAFRD